LATKLYTLVYILNVLSPLHFWNSSHNGDMYMLLTHVTHSKRCFVL